MDCSKLSWVDNYKGKYNYVLKSKVVFKSLTEMDFGSFKAYDLKDDKKLLIEGKNNEIIFYPGYTWDGCTCIGKIKETEATLLSSIFHDGAYQVGKQKGYTAAFNLFKIDKEFLWQMKSLDVNWFIRNTWWAGCVSVGSLWKLGSLDTLYIV